MRTIKILVAEDTIEARELIVDGLKNYAEKNYGKGYIFKVEEAESFQKGLQKLSESEKTKTFYDVFFADIDFTEDNKGGARDSGYALIEKAFKVCPITKIYTYSGQFHAKDLWPKYEKLRENGLIVYGMDKSHGEGGEEKWLEENFKNIVENLLKEDFLLNIWQNHQLIVESLKNHHFFGSFSGLKKFDEIQSNLKTILIQLKKRTNANEDIIVFRSVLQLYHRCLEIFCEGNKTKIEIFDAYNNNVELGQPKHLFLKNHKKIDTTTLASNLKPTAQQKLIAYSINDEFMFGDKLNFFRNESVHPNSNFIPELSNVLYANLAVTLYINGKSKMAYSRIEKIDDLKKEYGSKDLEEILKYLH